MHHHAEPTPTKNSTRVLRVLFTLFLIGTIAFIFLNSSDIGQDSSGKSAVVTEWLNRLATKLSLGFTFEEAMVRKMAHFAEYAMLGFWLMLTLRVYTKRILAYSSWPLLGGLLLATLDEAYQLTVPGRSGRVSDIAIDFAGVLVGYCVALFLQLLVGALVRSFRSRGGRQAPAPGEVAG